jgi:hypothetical protein
VEDLERHLHRTFDAEGMEEFAQAALDAAVAIIGGEVPRLSPPGTESAIVYPNGYGLLVLPHRPVVAITSIVALNGNVPLVESVYTLQASTGMVTPSVGYRLAAQPFLVTYTYGTVELPADVRFVILSLAARHLGNPDGMDTGQDYQDFHRTFRLFPGELSRTEQAILSRHRGIPSGSLRMVPGDRLYPRG